MIDYQLPHETIERLSQLKLKEWGVMQEYLHHDQCLMQFLSMELGDLDAQPCGRCANCDPDAALSTTYRHEVGVAAAEFMENILIEIDPKKQAGRGRAHAAWRFPTDQLPYNLQQHQLAHKPGRALCRWGEAGWGEIAMKGKHEGKFDPRLVGAAAKLIHQRWNPNPFPEWITFIPSHQHPELVSSFAYQLAEQLGIPCKDVIKKKRKNLPQKSMENSDFRCRNLDGAFEVVSEIPEGPLLLIDDAVDSGWSFAVTAALLRKAGSGPVFPFAVMSTSTTA